MKTLQQLIEERAALLAANEKAIKDGENGVRKLDEKEQETFDANIEAIQALDKEIGRVRTLENLKKSTPVSVPAFHNKSDEKFSLMRTIRNMASGKPMHPADQAVIEMGSEDYRGAGISPQGEVTIPLIDHRHESRADILAGTDTQGAEVVATDVLNLLGPLRGALVFSRFGASYLTGLVGNVDIPKYAGSTATWKSEVDTAADGGAAFSEISLAPLRLTGYMDVSKRFLIQDSANAEALLKMDFVAAVAGALEQKLLSEDAASAGVSPAGLFTGTPDLTAGSVPSWAKVVALETAVDAGNALEGNLGYISTPAMRGLMKSTLIAASTDSRHIMEGKDLNGYPFAATSNCETALGSGNDEHGIAFANWRHLIIGQWGGVDMVVDPYSLATTAQVRITINSYWDAAFRHADALAWGSCTLS